LTTIFGSEIEVDITAKTKNFNMNLIVVFDRLTILKRDICGPFCKVPELSQALAHTFGPFSHELPRTVTVSQSSSTA
jgi:hypothetical protein